MKEYVFKLFITGSTSRSEGAVKSLKEICEKHLKGRYKLEIVDVLENPEVAEDEKVMATPTLIKHLPPPVKRLVGDLHDQEKVKLYLDIQNKEG